jgi:hypothetical protein
MATPNIEYSRALSADSLERRLCGPLEIRPKILVVEIVLLPNPQNSQTTALKAA